MNLVMIIVQWAIPFFLTALFGFVIKYIKKLIGELDECKSNNEKIREGMISLLRSHIGSKAEIYISKGYLPDDARECLDDLFREYTSLGGNHGVSFLVNNALNLPPRKDDDYEV